jgi:hypothetical protein
MNFTLLNKHVVEFHLTNSGGLTEWQWLGKSMINDLEIEFDFPSHLIAGDNISQPNWDTIQSFLEFFFKHMDSIFKTSREIIIAFLKVFGMHESFVSYDNEEMILVYIELLDTENNSFSISYHIESDRYYSYIVEFYELSSLLVLKGVKRE